MRSRSPTHSGRIEAPHDEVHVWRISLDPPEPTLTCLNAFLAPDEQARADRFRTTELRGAYVAGRGALRTILGRYLGIDPASVAFRYGPQGKPELDDEDGRRTLHFNLTHSHGLALAAVARGRRVGVDLEALRPMDDADGLVKRFFSTREQAQFFAVPDDHRLRAFFLGWTRKEAYIKALGKGLSMPLDEFSVSLTPGEPPRLIENITRPEDVARWTFAALDPGPGFVGTVAVEGAGWDLRWHEFEPEVP